MTDLHIPLKREYFLAIKSGAKLEEYRLVTPYWTKRLVGRVYDRVILADGYPPRADVSRRIARRWNGFRVRTITHPHFGDRPVEVYAIDETAI